MPTSIGLRWYQTGTVSVTQGSTALTGVGTNWAGAGIKAGDIFTIDNSVLYEVLTVNSNTDITLATAFAGVTGETLNYSIIRNFAATMQAEIAAQVALLVNKYETYIDTELETITGPKGDPGIVYKGVWEADRNYNAMDAVLYNTVLYIAKVPHISSAENAPGSLGSVWVDTLINVPPVINDLTTGGADAALSAQMGVTLQQTKFNASAAGDMSLLNTTAKSTFVSAINEVLNDVGTLSNLDTTAKSSAVAAINEVNTAVGAVDTKVGALTNLTTTDKDNVVSAVNEVNSAAAAVDLKVGALSGLTTTDKTDTVSAINEVDGEAASANTKIGTLTNLTTNTKTSLVGAVNYLDTFNQGGVPDGQEITESWSDLQARGATGDFSGIHIGDFKTITLTTNEVVVMEVAGIDRYYRCGDTEIGHHIDFISRDCLAGGRRMNATNTNNGTASEKNPWRSSELFQTLNNTSTGVFSTLPSDLKNCIIEKRAMLEERYSSGGAVSADTGWAWYNMGKLWLPTEVEVFGHHTWSEPGYGTGGGGCNLQYPIFMGGSKHIIKGDGNNGSRCIWWEASAVRALAAYFCLVNYNGDANDGAASGTGARAPLCFRIGEAA